jgi:hypothetical protein
LSIPRWRNCNRWQNNNLQSLSNLPPICLLSWKLEHCCSLKRLIIASFWPSFRICRSQGVILSFAKRVQGAHLQASHKTNYASSTAITSNWIKLVPTCTSHVDGTSGPSTQYFLPIPPTERVKSFAQTKTCDGLVQTHSNQTTNHRSMD